MEMSSHDLGPLGEPNVYEYLRVVRRELPRGIGDELQSSRAKMLLDMTLSLLDSLLCRDGVLEDAYALRCSGYGDAFDAFRDPSQSDSQRSINEGDAFEIVERNIRASISKIHSKQTMPRLELLNTLRGILQSEAAFLNTIGEHEQSISTLVDVPNDAVSLDAESITAYLQGRSETGLPVWVKSLGSPLGGYSKDVFVIELDGAGRPADRLVIRRDLPNGPLESSVADEFELLQTMHCAGIPVAEPLWLELDTSKLGGPVMVSAFVEGDSPTDHRANVRDENAVGKVRQFAQMLAAIHSVPVTSVTRQIPEFGLPVAQLIQKLLNDFRDQWLRRRKAGNLVISAALAWMESNIPQDEIDPVIVHGDYSLRNLLFVGEDVSAILDWETWHIGDPAEDLAYCRPDVEAVMPWSEFLAEYRAAGGRAVSDERIFYWRFWKYLRGAITSISMMNAVTDKQAPADIRTAFGGVFFTRFCLTKICEFLNSEVEAMLNESQLR